ncbi:MAG: electron transport complex subunit RsxD [Gammaproteobacteria bacterium]|nr:electron transport complex subunit RsxD [Gammaproteobacteria bacterium]
MSLSSPFIHQSKTTAQVMALVCLALLPAIAVQFYYFGAFILINLTICSLSALLFESLIMYLRKRPILGTISDNSALLTGLLLGLALPPLLPFWMSILAVLFAIVFAKHLYGGLGYNPFNPAMIGYVVLLISFPAEMSAWLPSNEIATKVPGFTEAVQLIFTGSNNQQNTVIDYRLLADGFTMATPIDQLRAGLHQAKLISEISNDSHFTAGLVYWQWLNIAFLTGGVFLLFSKIVRWQIPFSFLFGILITSGLLYLYDDQAYASPLFHLLTGATMMGAFFIATDPVTASTTPKGRIIYGLSIGFLIVIIRVFGGYPDAVAFAVLLLNIAVPTIDHYTKPVIYGHNKGDIDE